MRESITHRLSTLIIIMVSLGGCMRIQNENDFNIQKMTLAVTNTNSMVIFYNVVFESDLKKEEAGNYMLYSGKLGPIELLLCPNELANVNASQNRQQFEFFVQDLYSIEKKVLAANGQIKQKNDSSITVLDPDNNTIIFSSSVTN